LLTANPIIQDLKYHNKISSQPKVICYLQFHTCNWTGDQQSTVTDPHTLIITEMCGTLNLVTYNNLEKPDQW